MTRCVPDDALVAAVERLAANGATDPMEGGVAPATLADDLGMADYPTDRLERLVGEDRLRRVQGWSPEGPRRGYLPAEGTG
jgi:hypothetical protein